MYLLHRVKKNEEYAQALGKIMEVGFKTSDEVFNRNTKKFTDWVNKWRHEYIEDMREINSDLNAINGQIEQVEKACNYYGVNIDWQKGKEND